MKILLCLALIVSADRPQDEPSRPTGIRQITPTLQVNFDSRTVILDTEVVLREGPLELLICPKRTKEHESILAAEIVPKTFHLALLLSGFKPGRPAEFEPYQPPIGEVLEIELEYEIEGKQSRINAREWIRNIRTGHSLDADFVFAGSRFFKIPGETRAVWQGDDGDMVCVTNFPGSIIDIAMKSSTDNANLAFEAWTQRIPPIGTKVRVYFSAKEAPAAAR